MICPRCAAPAKKNGAGRARCRNAHSFFVAAAEAPEGQSIRGTSTLVDMRTGDTVMQWVKTDRDAAAQRAAMEAAERGEITDVFLLYGLRGDYGSAWYAHDFDDLVLQIGTEHLRLRAAGEAERAPSMH